ncbi:hypothetical protein TRFO_11406 [Tritrichomonas foetus]|uniref:FERM domain-containing protein n=1 Tax=Tritrichomonas foetus TaxID=1144522 RepID=A0A1J4J3W2_9EUKA|nr:hypothetical protein TRFO_11406 [Tritrichomonas foetus]|eukprot:OHS94118.1 hypothetical protein TRFO_11406 [Tritrichomonas foetus]
MSHQIELRTSRHIDSERSKSCTYNLNKKGEDILYDALECLRINEPGPYKLFVKMSDSSYKLVDFSQPFKNMNAPNHSHLIVVKEQTPVKITTEQDFARTIMLKLTAPIYDLLNLIAEKLHFHCQPDQYALWKYNDVGEISPLDSYLSIAEQASDYKRLLFKRRYFMVFVDEFDDYDQCLHVFRDIRNHYLKGPCQVNKGEALNIASLLIYANAKSIEEAKEFIKMIPEMPDLKCLLPPSAKIKLKHFKKDLIQNLLEMEQLDKLVAMQKFILAVRVLKNYGTEIHKGSIVNSKGYKTKCLIQIGPRGIRVMDLTESKDIENVRILNILSFSVHKKRITIKYSGPKGQNDTQTLLLSIPRIEWVFSLVRGNIAILEKHYQKIAQKRKDKANGLQDQDIELVAGQYNTLIDAENAIEIFIKEMKEKEDVDFSKHGLKIVTTKEECQKDDISQFDELNELLDIVPKNNDFGKLLYNYMPLLSFPHISGEVVIRKLKIFEDDVIAIRGSVYHLHIKDCIFLLQTALDFSMSIPQLFPQGDFQTIMEEARSFLQKLYDEAKVNDSKGRGISEMSKEIVENLNKIVEKLPSIKAKVSSEIEKLDPLEQLEDNAQKYITRGQMTLLALLNALNEFHNYVFQKRDIICKLKDINCYFGLNPSVECYLKLQELANSLIISQNDSKLATISKFNEATESFKQINSFISEILKSEFLSEDISEEIKARIHQVHKLFHILHICFLDTGEVVGVKLFPGTLTYMFYAMNALQDMEQTIRSLSMYDFSKNNSELSEKLDSSLEYILSQQNILLSNFKLLQRNPSDEDIRCKSLQSLHESKYRMYELFQEISPYSSIVDASNQFSNFFEAIDNSLFTLTPNNCNPPRVDTCIKSLNAIIKAMTEKHIDQQWIDRIQLTVDKMKELYAKLVLSPTDGRILQPLHEFMLITLRYIQTIDKYLSIGDHRTIPLIIELLSPSITQALGNPYITDEFERCEHIIKMNQMHYDIALLINMYLTMFEMPNISIEDEIIGDLKKRICVLQKLFVEFSMQRPNFMKNPYTYSILLPILKLINNLKVTEANMIAKTRDIDNFNMNHILKKCLCQSMISVNTFLVSINKLNIHPYRKLMTPQSVLEYRKSLISLVAIIKNLAIGVSPDIEELLNLESMKFLRFIGEISKESKTPSHKIEDIVMSIDKYLDGIYARANNPVFTGSKEVTEKVDNLQNENEKIIRGEKPTPALLESLLMDMVESMNDFHQMLNHKNSFPDSIREIAYIWDAGFQDLIENIMPIVNEHNYTEEIIIVLKKIMLLVLRMCPNIPENFKNTDIDNYNIMNQVLSLLDDNVNLTRQFPELITISLTWQKLEVSIAEEIQELGEVIMEQFEILASVFNDQLLPHLIVRRSGKLTTLITELGLFFQNNFELLNQNKDILESFIEKFCRDIQLTLEVINENVRLLHPIMSDTSLIESCDALATNVSIVIKRFDQHHMTKKSAQLYRNTVVPDLRNIRNEFLSILDDPIISLNQPLAEFLRGTSDLINLLPDDVSSMKPSQLQKHCDKVYQFLGDNIPSLLTILNSIGVSGHSISLYKNLMKFTSLEHKKIMITESLLVKLPVLSPNEIVQMFDEILNGFNEEDGKQNDKINELITQIFEKLEDFSISLPPHINTASRAIYVNTFQNSSKTLLYDSLRCLAMIDGNRKSSHKHYQDILIMSSCQAAAILEEISKSLMKIPPHTIYHQQLVDLISQTDTSTLSQLKTLPAVFMTYANLRKIDSLLPLVLSDDVNFNHLSKQFNNLLNQADLALSNDILKSMDYLVNCLEIQGIYEDFVQEASDLLQHTTRGLTFNLDIMSKLSNLFIIFESQASNEINHLAARFDKMDDAKYYINNINQYKPILSQWITPTASTSETLLKTSIQSNVSSLLYSLTLCKNLIHSNPNKIPFNFSIPRSQIDQIIAHIAIAQKQGINVDKYLPLSSRLAEILPIIDKSCDQLFIKSANEKSIVSLSQSIPELIDIIKGLQQLVGPIDIIQNNDNNLKEEEEEEIEQIPELTEPEEKIEIDTFELVLSVYKTINSLNYTNDEEIKNINEIILSFCHDIETLPDLEPLREFSMKIKEYLDNKQYQNIANLKTELAQYLVDRINWQSNIINNIPLGDINDSFIDKQRELNELSLNYINSSSKSNDLQKLSKIAADTQSLTVCSYKYYSLIPSNLYMDLYQTSIQMWGSLLELFGDPTNISIKRSFRSIARLMAGLSYLVEDASFLQNENENTNLNNISEFNRKKVNLLAAICLMYQNTAIIISLFSSSPIYEVYQIALTKSLPPLHQTMSEINDISNQILKLNSLQKVGEKYQTHLKVVEESFVKFSHSFKEPKSLKSLIEIVQCLHTSLNQIAKISSELNDVVVQVPDTNSASKLPKRILLPSLSNVQKLTSSEAFALLEKVFNELSNEHNRIRKCLFDSSDVKNDEIVETTLNFLKIGEEFVKAIFQTSNSTINISIQEDLASSASLLISSFDNFNKSVKSRLLLKSNWVDEANLSLNLILEESKKIFMLGQKNVELEDEDKKKKDDADRQIQIKFDEAATPIKLARSELDSLLLSLNELSESLNRDWATDICKLGVNSTNALSKIIIYTSDHPSEILTSVDSLVQTSHEIFDSIKVFINSIHNISQCQLSDIEEAVINSVSLLNSITQSLNSHYAPKSADSQILNETILEIIKGLENIKKTMEETIRKRNERIEASKKRQEEIAARKKEAEERRKNAPKVESNVRAPGKTHEQLMKRLELESKIIQARMAVEHQKNKLASL